MRAKLRRKAWSATIVAAFVLPVSGAALAADEQPAEVETDELPTEAWEELEAAKAATAQGMEAVGQAQTIPDPPEHLSRANRGATPQAYGPGAAPTEVAEVPPEAADRGDVQFEDFYQGLSGHGAWIETPEYGYVFVPHRQAQVQGWRPYLHGRWLWTRHGWTWISDEPFGWATYHYGRWTWVGSYGWAWVPGYTWGPAWVAWRYGDGVVGWAPLYPGYVAWRTGYPYYADHWIYIGPRYFYGYPVHRHYHRHYVPRYYESTRWARHWRSGGHGAVYAGPPRSFVQRRAGVPIRTTTITRTNRPAPVRIRDGRPPERVSVYVPDRSRRPEKGRIEVPRQRLAPGQGVGSGLVKPRPGDARGITVPRDSRRPSGTPRIETPRSGSRSNPPRIETPRSGSRSNPPRIETPRSGSRSNPPRIEAPRSGSRSNPPRIEAPRSGSRSNPPRIEAPRSGSPGNPPRIETPRSGSPGNPPRIESPRSTPRQAPQPRIETPRSTPRQAPQPRIEPPRSNSLSAPPRVDVPRAAPRSSPPRIEAPRSAPRSSPPRIEAPRSNSRGGPTIAPSRDRRGRDSAPTRVSPPTRRSAPSVAPRRISAPQSRMTPSRSAPRLSAPSGRGKKSTPSVRSAPSRPRSSAGRPNIRIQAR